MSYLLDTNTASELMKVEPHLEVIRWIQRYEDSCYLSAITVGEIERGIALLPQGNRKRSLEKSFEEVLLGIEDRLLSFDHQVARNWASLSSYAKQKGRTLSVLDSMIEATALHWNLIVVTRNVDDFLKVKTINPWLGK